MVLVIKNKRDLEYTDKVLIVKRVSEVMLIVFRVVHMLIINTSRFGLKKAAALADSSLCHLT